MHRVAVINVSNPEVCPYRQDSCCNWWHEPNHGCNRWSTISDKGVTYYERIFPEDCPLTEMEDD